VIDILSHFHLLYTCILADLSRSRLWTWRIQLLVNTLLRRYRWLPRYLDRKRGTGSGFRGEPSSTIPCRSTVMGLTLPKRSEMLFLNPFLSFATSTSSPSTCIGLPYHVVVALPFFAGVLCTCSLSTFIGISVLAVSEVNSGLLSSSVILGATCPEAPRRFDGLHSRSE